jgi:hypothetical protein
MPTKDAGMAHAGVRPDFPDTAVRFMHMERRGMISDFSSGLSLDFARFALY